MNRAWRTLFARARPQSRYTQGPDGVSLNDFALDLSGNLRALSQELRNGTFKFQPLRPQLIPKPNNAYRLICVPAVRDRVVQRALLELLSEKYGARLENSVSFGFVRRRTVEQAGRVACSLRKAHPWAFKTDVTSFFDRIDRHLLRDRIQRVIRDKSLHGLLFAALGSEIATARPSVAKKIRALGIREGRGVRQGMPLSPFFANLVLQPFDAAIEKQKLKAVRYADDLIFLADTEQECHAIEAFCRTELAKLGLDIPPIGPGSKSVLIAPSQAAEFLGLAVSPRPGGYELRLMSDQVARIRAEVLQLGSIPELLARGVSLRTLGAILQARIGGYLSAYACCTNILELENALQDIHQRVLRRIYREGLGIDLTTLSAEKRTFLGLT